MLAGCKEAKKNEVAPAAPDSPVLGPPPLEPKNVTIEVVLLQELPEDLPEEEIVNYIQLVDGNSGSVIGYPTNFTVSVFAGKKVKWKGKKLPGVSGQKPRIDSISMKVGIPNNVDLVENGQRINDENQQDNDLEFTVKSNLNPGDMEHYKIVISFGQGNNKKSFPIDPILNWHP